MLLLMKPILSVHDLSLFGPPGFILPNLLEQRVFNSLSISDEVLHITVKVNVSINLDLCN